MNSTVPPAIQAPESEKATLGVILFSRTNLNIPIRLTYFFLPAIARGLGVSLAAASVLVSARSAMGIVAPVLGSQSDRWGGRKAMGLGLALLVVGSALTFGLPWYWLALFAFGLFGLAKSAYDPAMQVYVGRRVPYERRGRVLGLTELAWSGALLVMPLCGWLIARAGWRSPFGLIALLGIVSWWLTRRVLVPSGIGARNHGRKTARFLDDLLALSRSIRTLWRDPQARLALSISALLVFAQDTTFIVYGAWMEDSFGLTVAALGLVTLVVGVAELNAELGVALLSDRLGKRRAIFLSLVFTGCGYLLLPQMTGSLLAALAGTAFVVLGFEFSIVGLIPIVSGLNATARGTLMSLNISATSVGRVVAAPLAVTLYQPGDITRNGLISAIVCLVVLALLTQLRERGH